ncbi:MAG: glycoside hydrolase family 2 protein [Bacteroidales bacterium]
MFKKIFVFILFVQALSCKEPQQNLPVVIELKNNWTLVRESDSTTYPAKIPGSVHMDLLENKVIEDPYYRVNEKKLQWIDKEDWSYVSEFEIHKDILSRENVELDFKGLDTYADVYLNDSLILKADNMFREWKVDSKNYLKEGKNKIRILFHSPIKIGLEKLAQNGYPLPASNDQSENGELGDKRVSPFTRKAPYHYGWDWGPRFVTSGIWRPVYIRAWDKVKIENIQIVQDKVSKEQAEITAVVNLISKSDENAGISIIDKSSGKELVSDKQEIKAGENSLKLHFKIENPELWWTNGLGNQHLYEFETKVFLNGAEVDNKTEKVGLRSLRLVEKPDNYGKSMYFELNGVPVFMKGANHIPNDVFLSRVTPNVYEHEVKTAAVSNMNMLRVWGGGIYEDDEFYNLCDKYGILVWQDFMFACSMYPGNDNFIESIKQEAKDNIIRLRNHPSLALWCGNNEIDAAWSEYNNGGWGWKQLYNQEQHKTIWENYEKIFLKALPEMLSKYDTTRVYRHSSPIAGPREHASYTNSSGDMHYWGVWHGLEPFSEFRVKRARFMSEYGFQSFPEFNTVKKYALPEDFNIGSEVMTSHQRSGIGNLRIKEYMSWDYKTPKDFEHFLYVGQVLQAEGIKWAIEAHRRDMPYCMGTLYWQINDCWPVASWSSMDYYGNWKALQFYAKKAFEPVLVSPDLRGDTLNVYIVSDKLESIPAKLHILAAGLNGKKVFEKLIDVHVEANTSKIYLTLLRNELLNGADPKEIYVEFNLLVEDKTIASNLLHLVPVKDLNLKKANIKSVVEQKNDEVVITLTTDLFAKNVYLNFDGVEGFFSDNYFDILPGKPVQVTFKSKSTTHDLKDKLKIISLVDSY